MGKKLKPISDLDPKQAAEAMRPRPQGMTPAQQARLRELTQDGAIIPCQFTQQLVDELRSAIRAFEQATEAASKHEQAVQQNREMMTKMSGQIGGLSLAITRWEERHGDPGNHDPS